MNESLYEEIYQTLKIGNIDALARDFGVRREILQAILNLKLVRRSKQMHQRIKEKSGAIRSRWENGEPLLKISSGLNFSPVLVASFIMCEGGIDKGTFKRMLENPGSIKGERLKREMREVVKRDFLYSPRAHEAQRERGTLGEKIIEKWLVERGAKFVTEKESTHNKTPDFVLETPMAIDGKNVSWIDSKAVFCDLVEHKRYTKKQFADYIKTFGDGMVVYWYGFVDSIEKFETGIVVKDHTFFDDPDVKKLFDIMR